MAKEKSTIAERIKALQSKLEKKTKADELRKTIEKSRAELKALRDKK